MLIFLITYLPITRPLNLLDLLDLLDYQNKHKIMTGDNNEMEFNCISCESTRDMCIAVQQLELWEFFRNFEPDEMGFMFSFNQNINRLSRHPLVEKHGHSGSSFGICCRNIQFIAMHGLDAWCARFEIPVAH